MMAFRGYFTEVKTIRYRLKRVVTFGVIQY